jgi:hypothetical protein
MIKHFVVAATLLAGGMLHADPGKGSGSGITVSVHGDKIDINGIQDIVDEQLENAIDAIDNAKMPHDLRAKLKTQLGTLRGTLRGRLKNMNAKDLDQLGKDLDKMGEDISKQMEAFGSDMDKWGKQFGKDWAKNINKQIGRHGVHVQVNPGHDDDDDDLGAVDVDDEDDLDDAIRDLGNLKLQKAQKDAIAKIRADSDKQATAAKQALETASKTLHDQLAGGKASDADIAKSIDAVAQQEAAVRKARILAWVNARRVLDDAQRKRIEDAAKGKTK